MAIATACRRLILCSSYLHFMTDFRLQGGVVAHQFVLHAILIGQSEVAGRAAEASSKHTILWRRRLAGRLRGRVLRSKLTRAAQSVLSTGNS